MKLNRRELLLAAGSLPLTRLALGDAPVAAGVKTLPFKQGFVPMEVTYLNSGSQHPLSLGSLAEAQRYLAKRSMDPAAQDFERNDSGVLEKYARLVNADIDEVAFVQSTTAAEQMFLRSLGFPEPGGHIVTDTLHFFGSFPLYEEMQRQGMEVTWVRAIDGRISLEQMRESIRPGTRLVALSLVSTYNGFQHDLKAVCDMAHEVGALVYADIIHAVGCVPVDLHASGVDLAAGASYKWLMGEFGLGFLYVRRDVQPHLKRSNYGYYGMSAFQPHVYPLDPPGSTIADYAFADSATGQFALGTHAHLPIVVLNYSLDYLLETGVPNIQAYTQSMIAVLKQELPERGFEVITPAESPAPIITCVYPNAREVIRPKMVEAGIEITVSRNSFRVTPSVFNDMNDINHLLTALGTA
ncbi:MAG TPA: aminotransferase class V-fold PLP-dependent enzyme [Xanthomonadales bacterium]|nr:aminotransferase class V-fold PLP-dependent enzyme [Xanthomonadales bacterium]